MTMITANNDAELFKKEIEYLWDSNNLQWDMKKDLERLADKLAEYEDTGLTPKQIVFLMEEHKTDNI